MRLQTYTPLPLERIIAVLSYLSSGFVGFIWIIIAAVTRQNLKHFVKFHVFQSIFLSILFFLVSHLLSLFLNLLSLIPFINSLSATLSFYLSVPVVAGLSVIKIFIVTLIAYLSFGAIMGRYSHIPWVSDIIKINIGR